MRSKLPASLEKAVDEFIEKRELKAETVATREASRSTLEIYVPILGELPGGSADLIGSNLTNRSGSKAVRVDTWGNHISYGVRELGISTIMNDITLHGGYTPYGDTLLTFSDYGRNALRMTALMKIRSILVLMHGSIGLGEDGPTHQSIEHVASLRLIPNMDVWRTADTTETAVVWVAAIERQNGPSRLIFSRQSLSFQAWNLATCETIARGGYMLHDAASSKSDVVIIAIGSEVDLAVGVTDQLAAEGIHVRVVSVPTTTVFGKQDSAYKAGVLPAGVSCIVMETGVIDFWRKYQV